MNLTRGRLRRFGAAWAVALVGALTVAAGPSASAQTEPVDDGEPPSMTLENRSPWVEADGTIALDITTRGPESAFLQVVVRTPVDSVEDLDRSLDEAVGGIIHRFPPVPVGFVGVRPDGSRRVSIPTSTTRSDETTVRLRQPGVYPVVVTLSDENGVVDEIRTPVVRLGTEDDPLVAPRLELLADLSVTPTIEPEGRRELDTDELDRLDRLGALIDGTAVGNTPDLTVSISPDTLDALTASPDARAGAVLEALTHAGPGSTALGLPTVPLSAAAIARAGLQPLLVLLLEEGRGTLDDRMDARLDTSIWDAGDGLNAAGASLLATAGLTHVLLEGSEPDTDSAATERRLVDAGPVPIVGIDPIQALLTDTDTGRSLLARGSDRVDAGHIALADLLIRDDGEGARVVIAVDDAPEDSLLLPTLALLTTPGSPIGLGPVTAPGDVPDDDVPDDDVPDDELDEGFRAVDAASLPEATTDLAPLAARVRGTVDDVASFAGLVGPESARADELRLRIATSIASGVADDARSALLDSVEDEVHGAFGAVTLGGQTDLNLTSRSGTLPLRIHNDNGFPVQVVLHISSDRLRFPEGDRILIDADEGITRVDVPVDAQATGSVPTFVEIRTPDDRVVLDERTLDVRSTAISGVGLALSLGALAVLVFWWARTWRRNRRDGHDPA